MNPINRRGITMIELLIVSSIAVTLMTINIGWIHQSMKHASEVTQRQHHHRSSMLLASELRADVRYSATISLSDEVLSIKNGEGGETKYSIEGNVIRRTSKTPSGPPARSDFIFSDHATIKWDSSAMPKQIGLLIKRITPTKRSEEPEKDTSTSVGIVDVDLRVGPVWDTVRRFGPGDRLEDSQ